MAEKRRPSGGISLIQVIASALAAVTATLALSYLGAAGTILGAALASAITVVGNFLYSRWLSRTHAAVKTIAKSAASGLNAVLPSLGGSSAADAESPTSPETPTEAGSPERKAAAAAPVPAETTDAAETAATAQIGPMGVNDVATSPNIDTAVLAAKGSEEAQNPTMTMSIADGAASADEVVGEDDNATSRGPAWWAWLVNRFGIRRVLVGLGILVFVLIMTVVTIGELLAGNSLSDSLRGLNSDGRTTIGLQGNPPAPEPTHKDQVITPTPTGEEPVPTGEPSTEPSGIPEPTPTEPTAKPETPTPPPRESTKPTPTEPPTPPPTHTPTVEPTPPPDPTDPPTRP
jgi:hypothetical protein